MGAEAHRGYPWGSDFLGEERIKMADTLGWKAAAGQKHAGHTTLPLSHVNSWVPKVGAAGVSLLWPQRPKAVTPLSPAPLRAQASRAAFRPHQRQTLKALVTT